MWNSVLPEFLSSSSKQGPLAPGSRDDFIFNSLQGLKPESLCPPARCPPVPAATWRALFVQVGAVCCLLLWSPHSPLRQSGRQTWGGEGKSLENTCDPQEPQEWEKLPAWSGGQEGSKASWKRLPGVHEAGQPGTVTPPVGAVIPEPRHIEAGQRREEGLICDT